MAINMPQRGPKEDAWDKVAKALTIANQGIGIAANVQSMRKSSAELDTINDAKERNDKGILTPKEAVEFGLKNKVSDTQTPGSIPLQTRNPDGSLSTNYYSSPDKAKPAETPGLTTPKDYMEMKNKQFTEVPVGTKGSDTVYVQNPDGTIVPHGLMPPKFVDTNAPLSEKDRMAKLTGTDKQRFDNVVMANDAIADMNKALQSGQSRYSLIGDNDYTEALTRFDEALGRMQSGGAITKEEKGSFMAMARSLGDDPKMQYQKLQKLQGIMADRYRTLGFDPANNPRFAYKVEQPKKGGPSELVNDAQAGNKPTFNDEDVVHFKLAKERLAKNPNDAVAKQALEIAASKGLK